MLMKKDFLNLRRSRWLLLSLFALLVGVSPTWAETLTETFDDVTVSSRYLLSNGWVLVHSGGSYQGFGGSYDYQIKAGNYDGNTGNSIYCRYSDEKEFMVIPTKLSGTFTYYAKRAESSNGTVTFYEATKDGEVFTVTSNVLATTSTGSSWGSKSFSLGEEGKYVAINLKLSRIDQISATIYEATTGPALVVKDGSKVISPYAYDFGFATAGTTHEFTLSNPGTAAVEGLSVSKTGDFGATLSATSIAAGETATLTVTMPEATSSSEITISSTTEGIAPFVINASGTIRDASKLYEYGFTALPTDWTTNGSWYYSESNGAYTTSWYLSSNARLITPQLNVAEGETFFVEAKGYSTSNTSYQHLQMQYSADGSEWTNFDSEPTLDPSNWQTFAFTGVPAGKYYIAINASQADVRMFYGGKLPDGAKFDIDTDGSSQNFGMVMKDASATKTFTVTNNGNVALEVTFAPSAGFSTPASLNVAAGASETFDVVMNTTTPGAKSGNVVLSFDALNAKSFTIPVSGYVADPDKIYADFNDNQLPTGWSDNTGWTFSDGKAVAGYKTQMTLPALSVAEGEKLAICAMANGGYKELYYYTSTDGGSTWSAKSATNIGSSLSTTGYSIVYIDGLAAGNYKLKLEGYNVSIDAINGFTLNADAPALTVDPTTDAAFGKVKAQPAAKTYTITNSGTGTLTGTITSSDIEKFTVSENSFSLGAGENKTFEVSLVFDEIYGEKTATITIHPTNDGLTDVVINATATTADPNIWEEDFESGIPASWINENNAWTTTRYGHNGQAGPGYNKTYTLTTPRLQATKDQVLTFDVIDAESETYFLKAEYSTDRTNWTMIENYIAGGNKSFTAPADGYYWLRFTGNYTYVDNFFGFKEAPLAHDAAITAQSIPATGNQYVDYTATVTVKEMAGKAESGVVAKLYVDGVEMASDTQDLTANGTATFTMTFTPDAAIDAKKAYIKVTYEDVELTTDEIDLTIAAATVLNEAEGEATLATGTMPSVVVKYTPAAGWGTITMPFALTSDIMTSIFGEGWKAYELKGFTDNTLSFESTTTFYAGYPYIVYVETPAVHADGVILKNVNFSRATAQGDTYNGATFQGTYAPMAAGTMEGKWGVTSEAKIAKGNASASMKGFRAYFEGITAGASARLSFIDEDGTTTVINALELNQNVEGVYNLQGQKVERMQKGLYIVNGRKVVRK